MDKLNLKGKISLVVAVLIMPLKIQTNEKI